MLKIKQLMGMLHYILHEKKNHLEIVKYLISSGANIESQTNLGATPLHIACQSNNFEIVKYLISLVENF